MRGFIFVELWQLLCFNENPLPKLVSCSILDFITTAFLPHFYCISTALLLHYYWINTVLILHYYRISSSLMLH
jgi:hypothetical protein